MTASQTVDFFSAIAANNSDAVKTMLGTDRTLANCTNEANISALLFSAYANRPEIQKLLLAAGAEMLYHDAAAIGNTEVLKRWLDADPKRINALSPDGWTALHLASFFGQSSAAEFLVSFGADVNSISNNPMRVMPLHSALSSCRWKIARHLIERGADIHAPAGDSRLTPLHYAAANGSFELVDLFITLEADPHVIAYDGRTARQMAFDNKHYEVAEYLRGKE